MTITQLRAACEAATNGPLAITDPNDAGDQYVGNPDATFIALSREAVPKLLAFVEAWDKLQEHYSDFKADGGNIREFWIVNDDLLRKTITARRVLEE